MRLARLGKASGADDLVREEKRRSTFVTTTQLVAKQSQSVTQSHILHSQNVVEKTNVRVTCVEIINWSQ